MKKFLVGACIALLSHAVSATSDFEQLQNMAHTPAHLTGEFVQDKYLAAVETTLKSAGNFSYQAGEEVIWHTLTPVENTLKLTPEKIVSLHNGQQVSELNSQQNPVVMIFSDIFFGVMTADWALLERYFVIDASVDNGTWQAELTPLDPNIGQAISQVTLRGGELLQQVELTEANGNVTTIQFSDLVRSEGN